VPVTPGAEGAASWRRAGRPAKQLDPGASQTAFLGFELRRAREARALTLAGLAAATGYSAQHIGTVERGEAAPSQAFVAACDAALGAGGRLAILLPSVIREQAARRHERQARRRSASAGDADGSPPLAGRSGQDGGPEICIERLAAVARRGSGPTRRLVEEDLEPITRRHRSLYHELTSAELIGPVTAHLSLLTTLLQRATDTTRRSLASAASAVGETAGLAAWLHTDLGDVRQRDRLYRLADDALATSGDLALSAYVRGFRASVLLHDGDRRGGLSELDVAEAQASRSAPRVTAAWLAALRAQGTASVGEKTASLAALGRAETELEHSGADPSAEWMYDFDYGRLAGFLDSGEPIGCVTIGVGPNGNPNLQVARDDSYKDELGKRARTRLSGISLTAASARLRCT